MKNRFSLSPLTGVAESFLLLIYFEDIFNII